MLSNRKESLALNSKVPKISKVSGKVMFQQSSNQLLAATPLRRDTQGNETSNLDALSPLSMRSNKRNAREVMPSIMSEGARKSRAMYQVNYVLDIDSQILNSRQHSVRVNNFYKRLINQRIFQTQKPSPILRQERSVIVRQIQDSMKDIIDANNSIDLLNQNKTKKEFKQKFSEALYPSIGSNAEFKKQILALDLAPRLKNDDSIFEDESKQQLLFPSLTDRRFSNFREQTTQPQSSRDLQLAMESLVENSHLLDPFAGNSVITGLNSSVRADAREQIQAALEESVRNRSRHRRKRELAGSEKKQVENERQIDDFRLKGTLEDAVSISKRTETETLANSSIYNVLQEEIEVLKKDFKRVKKETVNMRESKRKLELLDMKFDQFKTENLTTQLDEKAALADPELYFKHLKAKIKLRATKQYQEDKVKRLEEDKKYSEPVVIIRDKFGRIMERKDPLMKVKRKPNERRKPIKRPPLRKRLSFTEDQLKYFDPSQILDTEQFMAKPTITQKITIDFMQQAERFPIPEALIGRKKYDNFKLHIDSLIVAAYTEKVIKEHAFDVQEVDAPYNSMESQDEFSLHGHSSSDEEEISKTKKSKKDGDKDDKKEKKEKKIDLKLLQHWPFRIEPMRNFPFRAREGEVPIKLLKVPNIEFIQETSGKIAKQQEDEKWSKDLIQDIFEHFCIENKAAAIDLSDFFDYTNPNSFKLSFRNIQLDDGMIKALCCVLPYITEIKEIEFSNNQISDLLSAVLLISIFTNPSIKKITISYNYCRQTFSRTWQKLVKDQPDKIADLNVMGSLSFPDHVQTIINGLPKMQNLSNLNIAGCGVSQQTCRSISSWIITAFNVRNLDVSHCRINYQGTRYIIDAVNRNTTIRSFNFSFNDLSSSNYEFSIKVASIITRHPSIQHLDVAHTNLKREEVLFIGLSMSLSKTIMAVHITAQGVSYYDRIFMRSVIAARVVFNFKNFSQKKEVKSNRERTQLLAMASGTVQENELLAYVDRLKELDDRREGLDFEIQDMLMELDTEATVQDAQLQGTEGALVNEEEQSKINKLVSKIVQRQKEIEAAQVALKTMYSEQSKSLDDQLDILSGIKDFVQYNMEDFQKGSSPDKKKENEDNYMLQKELKVERQRQRAELQVQKEGKDRSAGEIALMFMGINQVAQELLAENPMTGYMNEMVFSRILGHEDIEQGAYWVDTTQCWICNKWSKVQITYHLLNDKAIFKQKVEKIDNLHNKIVTCVNQTLEQSRAEELKKKLEMEEEIVHFAGQDERDVNMDSDNDSWGLEDFAQSLNFNKHAQMTQRSALKITGLKTMKQTQTSKLRDSKQLSAEGKDQDAKRRTMSDGGFDKTIQSNKISKAEAKSEGRQKSENGMLKSDKIDSESINIEAIQKDIDAESKQASQKTVIQKVPKPFTEDQDTTNTMSPVKITREKIEKGIYPKDFKGVNTIEPLTVKSMEKNMQQFIAKRKRLPDLPGGQANFLNYNVRNHEGRQVNQQTEDALMQQYMHSRIIEESVQYSESNFHQTSVISTHEKKKRARGEPVIIQRQIYFEGMVYVIDEEVYSDSDHSSVYTSEDDFEEDKGLQRQFKQLNPIIIKEPVVKKKKVMQETTSEIAFNQAETQQKEEEKKNEESKVDKKGILKNKQSVRNLVKQASIKVDVDIKKKLGASGTDFNDLKTPSRNPSRKFSLIDKKVLNDQQSEKKVTIDEPEKQEEQEQSPEKKNNSKMKNKSFSSRQQVLKHDFFKGDDNLTMEQERYELKTLPKHYKPNLAHQRVVAFNEQAIAVMEKERAKKNKKKQADAAPIEQISMEQKDIQIVASFNDWMPYQMKTLRDIHLEKFSMDKGALEEEIPAKIFMMDNTIALYANMVPPGIHYFYLVRGKGRIFLSPQYEVVRFKNTNIYLNKIIVQKRIEQMDTVFTAKGLVEDELIFMKDRSIFRDFREDTQQYLQKCFEEDLWFSKIEKLTKGKKDDVKGEFDDVKELLFVHYVRIKNIFQWYSGHSSYPTISMLDFSSFAQKCNMVDQVFSIAAMDLTFVATCVAAHQYKNSAERDLNRYEFFEIILRTAIAKYKETKMVETTCQAIEKLLNDNIYPNAKFMDGEYFRRYQCYNVKTNEILVKNQTQLKKVYDSFCHSKKKFVTLEELVSYIHKVGLVVSDMMIASIYHESLMTVMDTMRDPTRMNQMKFVEFIVFICRVVYEHYQPTKYSKELMYLKLDHLMSKILEPLRLVQIFSFDEPFQKDKKNEIRKQKLKRDGIKSKIATLKLQGVKFNKELEKELKEVEARLTKLGALNFDGPEEGGDSESSEDEPPALSVFQTTQNSELQRFGDNKSELKGGEQTAKAEKQGESSARPKQNQN